jgi:hypothetical protein
MEGETAGRPPAAADDWESRRLCSDGNCIGVIGPDGRCKECGRPADEPSPPAAVPPAAAQAPARAPQAAPAPAPAPAAPADGGAAADDWESRRLCSDGNCIGVIGPDGRCKECGRPYTG